MKDKRGGPGRGQGRKAADGATGVIRMTVHVTPKQREEVRRNGGSAWVRALIDGAESSQAKERERCAKICEDAASGIPDGDTDKDVLLWAADMISDKRAGDQP